jgi:hypothetical protein
MHAVMDLKDYKEILPAASIQNLSPPQARNPFKNAVYEKRTASLVLTIS